jgi:hypothetical protein
MEHNLIILDVQSRQKSVIALYRKYAACTHLDKVPVSAMRRNTRSGDEDVSVTDIGPVPLYNIASYYMWDTKEKSASQLGDAVAIAVRHVGV